MHMRTTLHVDDGLLQEAQRLTGLRGKAAIVRAALEALITRESSRRLAVLGGTEPAMRLVSRRRSRARHRSGAVLARGQSVDRIGGRSGPGRRPRGHGRGGSDVLTP